MVQHVLNLAFNQHSIQLKVPNLIEFRTIFVVIKIHILGMLRFARNKVQIANSFLSTFSIQLQDSERLSDFTPMY
jgi:hypothetical protein